MTDITNIYMIVMIILGVLVIALIFTVSGMSKTIKAYKKQLEKMSVNNDSSSSRVEVLEAKIKTLETALQKALDK